MNFKANGDFSDDWVGVNSMWFWYFSFIHNDQELNHPWHTILDCAIHPILLDKPFDLTPLTLSSLSFIASQEEVDKLLI